MCLISATLPLHFTSTICSVRKTSELLENEHLRKGEALRIFSYWRSTSMSRYRSGNEKALVDSEIYYVRGLSRRWQRLLKFSGRR